MTRDVIFRPRAIAELLALYDYIAGEAGLAIAEGFIERIEAACLGLRDFPERGSRRDDVAPGLRIIGFERRVTIAFRLVGQAVEIVAIAYAGRRLTPDRLAE